METKQIRNYELKLKPIGRGQFSHVCWAKDLKYDREVAVKSSSHLNTSEKEATVMKSYGNHPYLPKFYDYFVIKERAYIVMEYFPGEPLGPSNHDKAGKKRSKQQAVQITLNILKALQRLHKIGFAHNDLLPKNVLIMDDNPNKIKVIDFGIARPLEYEKNEKYKIKDLYLAALTCLYLIKSPLSETALEDLETVGDDKLQQVLTKGIKSEYHSAEEFIEKLGYIIDN